ncbi:hypothetical protein [Kitasatospora sp. McL0602]|uniref:hypothetical protein n=1 Tax=Kitasatospora sp. McL0602 TaxID=3439530 RepID=UPI003F8BAC53
MLLAYLALLAIATVTVFVALRWARMVRGLTAGQRWCLRLPLTLAGYLFSVLALVTLLVPAGGIFFIPLVVPLWLLTLVSSDLVAWLGVPRPPATARRR